MARNMLSRMKKKMMAKMKNIAAAITGLAASISSYWILPMIFRKSVIAEAPTPEYDAEKYPNRK